MNTLDEILKDSIIIAAHPDDEILWFSSILNKVGRIIICFLECEPNAQLTIGRKRTLSEYPMKNISCLEIAESMVFDDINFRNPLITKYGIEISNDNIAKKRYINNYYNLRKMLRNKLKDYQNVFTHNPWGEYGHEEHIQVYRVVKELQKEMKFNLWFSNYCSNKSIDLMLRHILGFEKIS